MDDTKQRIIEQTVITRDGQVLVLGWMYSPDAPFGETQYWYFAAATCAPPPVGHPARELYEQTKAF